MGTVVDLSKRRAASPTRTYGVSDTPFVMLAGADGTAEQSASHAPPSPVATAAKLLARAILWARDLTPRQKLEARLLRQTLLARSEAFQKMWQEKADLAALSVAARIKPRPALAITGRRYRHVTLWPWLLVGVVVAMAIAVTPVVWFGL
ncbi:hypothetical protein MMA231_02507 [Asticcacaulis sp. MM231]